MEMSDILTIVTFVVTLICGVITKKNPKLSNNIIPIQNIFIGMIMFIIDFIFTKDFSTAILVSGLTAGGAYDLVNNIKKMKGE